MNWYRTAMGLWEDVEKYGPSGAKNRSIEELSKMYPGIDKERLLDWQKGDNYFSYDRGEKFRQEYAWAVPTKKAIEEIKQFVGNEQVIEIGAGLGLWAKLLQDIGIHVVPIDTFTGRGKYYPENRIPYTDVEEIGHTDALHKYPSHRVLMLVWPPYDDPMAYETLKNFTGNKLIYVGESGGGCTGDDKFCYLLGSEWQEVKQINIPQWMGIHDYLWLYVRK